MSDVKPPPFNYEPFSGHFQAYTARLQADRAKRETSVSEEDRAKVLKLREVTSAGILACKRALIEADGDFDLAVEFLRTDGLAVITKEKP